VTTLRILWTQLLTGDLFSDLLESADEGLFDKLCHNTVDIFCFLQLFIC